MVGERSIWPSHAQRTRSSTNTSKSDLAAILTSLVGIQRAHLELYIRHLGGFGLQVSSVNTMMHGVRGFFRFAHIDGLITADPAVYARLPKIHTDDPASRAWTASS